MCVVANCAVLFWTICRPKAVLELSYNVCARLSLHV